MLGQRLRHARETRVRARQLLKQAVRLGDIPACVRYGELLVLGHGGPVDYAAARELFEKAVEHGLGKTRWNAMRHVGTMLRKGMGLPTDHVAALDWYEKAAQEGDPSSMHCLALMLYEGKGGLWT